MACLAHASNPDRAPTWVPWIDSAAADSSELQSFTISSTSNLPSPLEPRPPVPSPPATTRHSPLPSPLARIAARRIVSNRLDVSVLGLNSGLHQRSVSKPATKTLSVNQRPRPHDPRSRVERNRLTPTRTRTQRARKSSRGGQRRRESGDRRRTGWCSTSFG